MVAMVADPDAELTIDQLALASGLTTRNIRAHRTRGLLPPPLVRGRTGYYGRDHLARLQLIREMQERGLKLIAIERILAGVPGGGGAAALSFERAMLTWHTERPETITAEALAARLPTAGAGVVERIERLGLLVRLPDGDGHLVPSPTLLEAAEELVRLGLPIEAGIAVQEELARHSRGIARAFVRLFVDQVWRPFERRGQPEEEWPRVREALDRMRPLAEQALLATFRIEMDRLAATALEHDRNDGPRHSVV
jgi:DNA-binding transcriptional MerR regulator